MPNGMFQRLCKSHVYTIIRGDWRQPESQEAFKQKLPAIRGKAAKD
jgi:hypothetical protein